MQALLTLLYIQYIISMPFFQSTAHIIYKNVMKKAEAEFDKVNAQTSAP